MNLKVSIGDIVDRYTICKLKSERGHIDNTKELCDLSAELKYYDGIEPYVEQLYKLHGEIWDLEGDIRRGNEEILGLEEVGRRALQLRDMNKIRISIKNEINSKYHEGYMEVKVEHGSEQYPNLILSLTTVPERLEQNDQYALKAVLTSLCNQTDKEYELHFNIPDISLITGKPYNIPDWIHDYKLQYPHFKVFRTKDYGPPTKFLPTIERVSDPETIVVVVDDDQIYHPEMISEHRKYQAQLVDSCICYEGRGSTKNIHGEGDLRDCWVLCVTEIRETFSLQHYKSVSYKKKLFDEDFYKYYLGRTLSDDALISKYFLDKHIKMFVVPYEPENILFENRQKWERYHGVETFPIVRSAHSVAETGCNHPDILKHPLGARFYDPPTLGKRDYEGPTPVEWTPIDHTPKMVDDKEVILQDKINPDAPVMPDPSG